MFILFHIILLLCISLIICTSNQDQDLIWCNHCGVSIGKTSNLFVKQSPGAIKVDYKDVFGKNVTVQTLMNPFHFMFDVITIEKASCADHGRNTRGDSWFPGYTWRICTCPSCASQLGWTFEKALTNDVEDTNENQTFHALILDHLHGVYTDLGIALTPPTISINSSTTTKPVNISRPTGATTSSPVTTTLPLFNPRASDSQQTTTPTTGNTTNASGTTTQIPNNTTTKSVIATTTASTQGLSLNNVTSTTTKTV